MNIECPLPAETGETVRLGHGSGGELSRRLLQDVVFRHFKNPWITQAHDSATLPVGDAKLAFTSDSFVITPLFFPGGDIGKLAVYGTVNDLAMSGARPLYLSCSLILEEGLPMQTLEAVISSMAHAAAETGVQLVTGDTKVVERGKGDGLYINTAGIGQLEHAVAIEPATIKPGDLILLSGDIGRHGMAVMAKREGLEFDGPIQSDCAPLYDPVRALLDAGVAIHCLRDLTRGGLATALVELSASARRQFVIRESAISVSEPVLGACELLGLDPLYVANEGRFIAFIPPEHKQLALSVLANRDAASGTTVIGHVSGEQSANVILQNALGCERLLDMLPGEQLPRIC